MDDTMKSCREFVAVLASSAPAPGGGGAAALAAALAAAIHLATILPRNKTIIAE